MTDVDFGYRKVAREEKTRLVRGVFESVAENYDLMNDVMSFGTHRLFKRMTLEMSGVRRGHKVLDLAGGTGDLAALFAPVVGSEGQVVLADINAEMMRVGRDRLLDRGLTQVAFCQANGERLPFEDNTFNCITIGFGLRNFSDKLKALIELKRILVQGGALLVLEFSKPQNPVIEAGYKAFQSLWPGIGRVLVGDADSYQYLVESIDMHPSQEALKLMMEDAGFESVEYHNFLSGVAAIHRGEKP
jgi:demethylmenaquinone methyltransferase/2-methoxy-6-polyprenyl-1,4-benzoquinol methylase